MTKQQAPDTDVAHISTSEASEWPGPWPAEQPLPVPADQYDFFFAVRLLHGLLNLREPVGSSAAVSDPIRLRPSRDLGFPISDLKSVAWRIGPSGRFVEVVTNFLGLCGVTSPLPPVYAEQFSDDNEGSLLSDFFDVFHHRLLCLLYQGWLKRHPFYAYQPAQADPISELLLDLLGVHASDEEETLGAPALHLLSSLPLLLTQTRPASGLQALLARELGIPIELGELNLRWLEVPTECRFKITGQQLPSMGVLGQNIVVGTRHLDAGTLLRMLIGPLTYAEAMRFVPDGPEHQRLLALTRLYLRRPLDLQIEIIVPSRDVKLLPLGSSGPRLGKTAWAGAPGSDLLLLQFDIEAAGRCTARPPRQVFWSQIRKRSTPSFNSSGVPDASG